MAWTPLAHVAEEAGDPPRPPSLPSSTRNAIGHKDGRLPPLWYLILGKVFEGKKAKQIAGEVTVTPQTLSRILKDPAFVAAVERVEDGMLAKIERGEFGAQAIFKANAVGAATRLVSQAKMSPDERVRFNANVKILEHAGVQAPRPQVTESPERLLDLMSAEEMREFVATGLLPERLHDQAARLSMSIVKQLERQRQGIEVSHAHDGDGDDVTSTRRQVRHGEGTTLSPDDDLPDHDEDGGPHVH